MFVTIEKFSEMTGLPEKTIRIATGDGRLIWGKFGKRIMIDVDAYIISMKSQQNQLNIIPILPEIPITNLEGKCTN